MMKRKSSVAGALVSMVVVCLSGCSSHDHAELGGIGMGMTRDQVVAAAQGATLYCRGQGDEAFERSAGLPADTTKTWCTWASGSGQSHNLLAVKIGNTDAKEALLVLGPDGRVSGYTLTFADESYGAVVDSLEDKLGSPENGQALGGVRWTKKDGQLDVYTLQDNRGPVMIASLHQVHQQATN